jgi:hypothetical protein
VLSTGRACGTDHISNKQYILEPTISLPRNSEFRGAGNLISVILKLLATATLPIVAHNQIPREQKNLLPIIVYEWLGRVGAGRKPHQACAVATLILFVKLASDDLLLNASWISRQAVPAFLHVQNVEFFMTLVIAHGRSLLALL